MTPNEKLVWAAAFAAEMQYSGKPAMARWTAYKAVVGLRVAHEYVEYDRKLSEQLQELDFEMLSEMRK